MSEPIASPPNVRLPWRASSRSKGSIPSIPEGGVVPGSWKSSSLQTMVKPYELAYSQTARSEAS